MLTYLFFVLCNIDKFLQLGCLEEADVHAYTIDNLPLHNLEIDGWKMLFAYCDPEKLLTADGDQVKPFSEKILYRASLPEYKRGIYWTEDIKIAQFFLNVKATEMGKGEKLIYKTMVPMWAVAFYSNQREEDEYVLRPDLVEGLSINEVVS